MNESTKIYLLWLLAGAFAGVALTYVAFAFVQWQLNPGAWSLSARGAAVAIGAFLAILGAVFSLDIRDHNQDNCP